MPSQKEIADDWGVSKQYISKCVKQGCPTTTFEEAREWRDKNARNGPESAKHRLAALDLEREADKAADKVSHPAPPRARREKTGDAMVDAYHRAVDAFERINDMLQDAIDEGVVSKVAALLSIHNKALEAQFQAEKIYRAEMERRKVLVNLADAKGIALATFSAIIRRLDALPQKLALQVNKSDPMHALQVLSREVRDIKLEAAKSSAIQS